MPTTTTYTNCTPCCGGGTVIVGCCPDPIPSTLYLSFSAGSGGLECLSATSRELSYIGNVPFPTWTPANSSGYDGCSGNNFSVLELYCDENFGTWTINLAGCIFALEGFSVAETDCGPPLFLERTFTVTAGDCLTGMSGSITVTVATVP